MAVTADPAPEGPLHGPVHPRRRRGVPAALRPAATERAGRGARLAVRAAPDELRQPNVNRGALEQLAAASGGRLVELPDLARSPTSSRASRSSPSCTARPASGTTA